MEKNIFDHTKNGLVEDGFVLEEIEPSKGNESETLFTKIQNDTLYAAWRINDKQYQRERWYLGALPVSRLEDVNEKERLDAIAGVCTTPSETLEVEGKMSEFIKKTSFV